MALCEPKKLCDNVSGATVPRFHHTLCISVQAGSVARSQALSASIRTSVPLARQGTQQRSKASRDHI